MSKDRYSKLQKWILTHLYSILVDNEYSCITESGHIYCKQYNCEECSKERIYMRKDGKTVISVKNCTSNLKNEICCLNGFITNNDILVHYYHFQTRPKKSLCCYDDLSIVPNEDVAKARVTISRSVKTLESKGLIHVYVTRSNELRYYLSDTGIRKAEQLLNREEFELPFLDVNSQ